MAYEKYKLDPLALVFLDLWRRLPAAGTLNELVMASVLEDTVQGKRIPYLIWRGLAGFSDLLTVTL